MSSISPAHATPTLHIAPAIQPSSRIIPAPTTPASPATTPSSALNIKA